MRNRARNQRRLRTNSAKNPAVTRTSTMPAGKAAGGEIGGATTSTRSRQMAERLRGATPRAPSGTTASPRHGSSKKRRRKNFVSTGTLPYQMTRYWDQKKYIQRVLVARISLATSWIAEGETAASPVALALTARRARRANPV